MNPASQAHSVPPADLDFAPLGHIAPSAGGRTIDIVRFTLSIWKPLALGLGGGVLLGLAAYLVLGPSYDASTRILVSEKSSVSSQNNTANLVGDRGEHLTLIKSDAIVHRALTDHGLGKLPAFAGADDPVDDIIGGLKVARSAGRDNSKDNVFDIAFTHADPQTARQVVEAVILGYRDFLDERQLNTASYVTRNSEARLKELQAVIARLEQEHFAWRDKMPPIFRATPVVTAQGSTMVLPNRREQELDNMSKLLQDNFLAQQDVQAKLQTLRQMVAEKQPRDVIEFWIMHSLSTPSPTAGGAAGAGGGGAGASILAGPPAKASLDTQLLAARTLEARLLNVAGPDHDDVRKIRREIAAILSFYTQQGVAPPRLEPLPHDPRGQGLAIASGVDLPVMYEQTLENQWQFLKVQETALETQLAQTEEKAKQAALLELEDQRRKDEISDLKKELTLLNADIAAFRQAKDSEGFTVTSIAQVRVGKSIKRVAKLVGAGAMFGLCLVFGLAYFREWYDSTVRAPDEVRRAIGVPLLGAIPHFKAHAADRHVEATTGVSASIHYYHRPGSREAEAYRSIRTTLFAATKDSGDKVIQVSSPEPGDGKSTSAANLAVAIAQSGKKVLLIDADLRRPTVHLLFGVRGDVGLSEVLRREIAWDHAVQASPIDGLSLLACGQCPDNPAEMLSLAALGQLLRQARGDYDYILVDTPPILAVSDPCIISPHVDGMLLVIRMGKNKRAALTRTREALETHGVPLYGILANDLDLEINGYGSGNYHEYYRSPREPDTAAALAQEPAHAGARR
jgi:capsular exopolysaccharide synthesis family protein